MRLIRLPSSPRYDLGRTVFPIPVSLVEELFSLAFIQEAANVVFVGTGVDPFSWTV